MDLVSLAQLYNYVDLHKSRFLSELFDLLRFPSVSADPDAKHNIQACAEYLVKKLIEAGADEAMVLPTKGHPVVFGQKIINPHAPTILVYGHYDVQPPDPLELWENPPFEPVLKNDKIFARGACDDKGQMYMHVKALETMIANNAMTCNVKFLIEGEEEIGSEHLEEFLDLHRQRLQADIVLISDTAMVSLETPSIDTGLRGLAYLEIEVTGPNRDLHSGVYGGAVANPAVVLSNLIASLHDQHGRVSIPHFYDDVEELSPKERQQLNQIPFDSHQYASDLGVLALHGEQGYTTIERIGIRPTLEVNGIWSGYTGQGAKTVLPSKATAKISMRLVPNQDPERVVTLFQNHIQSLVPDSVLVKIIPLHGAHPVVLPSDSVSYIAASRAIEDIFSKKPIPVRGGGSIPIVALFKKTLQLPTVLLGFGLDSDNLHSPNEKFDLANYYIGIKTIVAFHRHFAELQSFTHKQRL